ncbi:hypothetical protein HAX54_028077, partial [Datura stramonium]|nr:hypothetical protein [Datura stramonium]
MSRHDAGYLNQAHDEISSGWDFLRDFLPFEQLRYFFTRLDFAFFFLGDVANMCSAPSSLFITTLATKMSPTSMA